MNVTFDVLVTKEFSDGILVHFPGEHLFNGPNCTISAT